MNTNLDLDVRLWRPENFGDCCGPVVILDAFDEEEFLHESRGFKKVASFSLFKKDDVILFVSGNSDD